MGFAYKVLPHYTYEDYVQWEGRWELIEGIPYAMAPMPIPGHQWVASNLAAEFRAAIKKSKCSCKTYLPIDYILSEDTIFNPDLLVVCQPITKKFLDFTPDLVVEILSESTGYERPAYKISKIRSRRYSLLPDSGCGISNSRNLSIGER